MQILKGLAARSRSVFAAAAVTCSVLSLAGCQGTGKDDAGKVNDALLGVLTSKGKRICVDARTHGEPLAVFRTMLVAPNPARRPLFWSTPAPLEQGRAITNRELVKTELGNDRIVLPEARQHEGRFAATLQGKLDALAHAASYKVGSSHVSIQPNPAAPLAVVRWWVRNRFDSSCGPIYTISKPVFLRGVAFLTVTAGHKGSTYAFRRTGGKWAAFAQWSTWLY